MNGYEIPQGSAAFPLTFLLIASSDHITGLTGKAGSVVVTISKNGAAGVTPSGAISEVDATNQPGLYKVAGNATDTSTLGPLWLHAKDAASDPTDMCFPVVAYNPQAASNLGLSALPTANPGAAGGLPTANAAGNVGADLQTIKTQAVTCAAGVTVEPFVGTVTAALAVNASGFVTVATNNDKAGYGLSQAFPTNFASLAITAGGAVTAGTVGDKTGYSLTQAFPANFSALSIDVSGRVDIGKILGTASAGAAGYVGVDWGHVNAPTTAVNLSGTTISTSQAVASVAGSVGSVTAAVTAGTVNDKAGYSLSSAGLDAVAVEAGLNARQTLAIIAAACACTGGTTSAAYKGAGVATTRIAFTAAGGERSAVTLSPPA